MIFVGLDDTDTLDTPGTNQLARHLVQRFRDKVPAEWIVRHQLLMDPRVPYTRKNGCVTIAFQPPAGLQPRDLAVMLVPAIRDWCPAGSDPGVCVIEEIPAAAVEFGQRCQQQFVRQADARELAAEHGIFLEGLGGTEDGVIGALAAVGLASTRAQGRVIYLRSAEPDIYDISGLQSIDTIHSLGIDEVRRLDNGAPVLVGQVEVGKRLRPNFCQGTIVLFVSSAEPAGTSDPPYWLAERVI